MHTLLEFHNKIGLSVEDKVFLEIMKREMFMADTNSWVAPIPFRIPRQDLPFLQQSQPGGQT